MRRRIQMPLYGLLVLAIMATLGPVGSFLASVQIANRNAENLQREQAASEVEAAAAGRLIVCGWFSAWLDTWDEIPPPTEAGRRVQARTLELYAITGCLPTRK